MVAIFSRNKIRPLQSGYRSPATNHPYWMVELEGMCNRTATAGTVVGSCKGICNEEVFDGYGRSDCIGRSCIGRRHGREGTACSGTTSDALRLERLLHWCQRWLGTEPQLLGFRHGGGSNHRRRLRGSIRRSHRWTTGISLAGWHLGVWVGSARRLG